MELGCDLKGYVETVRTYNAAGELIRTEEACSELEKTLTAAVMKWLEKHSLKPDFYESISSVQAHGIDDYFKKK